VNRISRFPSGVARVGLTLLVAVVLGWIGTTPIAGRESTPLASEILHEPTLRLRVGIFDPVRSSLSMPVHLSRSQAPTGPGLRLVQFPGPIQDDWYTAMVQSGLDVVTYIPEYAYLVWGHDMAIRHLAHTVPLRWTGSYVAGYALDPVLQGLEGQADRISVAVQVYAHADAQTTLNTVTTRAARVIRPSMTIGVLTTVGIDVAARHLDELAALPGVVSVEPWITPERLDEVQGQLVAGQLTLDGSQPVGPGYLSWLTETVGLSTDPLDYPIVDVTDDGIDDGSTAPQHPDFYEFGDMTRPDRLVYNHNWTRDPAADGAGGHGNINAAIVGGYNDLTGFPYTDAAGFNRGLGINPFGPFAGSKVFANAGAWQAPSYEAIVGHTYTRGARIISNSWGEQPGTGRYRIDDQIYDALVRDAVATIDGEQPVTIIFAAGNSGPASKTIGSPANAKNVITVGASESYRPTWTDGCGIGPTGADTAHDIAGFSSRGPTADGRVKPELVAPGTHIQGAATQSPTYTGAYICDKYRPYGQTLYAASSGTSHAAPAVAGAASLFTHYWQTNFSAAPPSPAMVKAYLVNAARYLDGNGSGDTLPSNNQGYGALDLGNAFSDTPRIVQDQEVVLHATGETIVVQGYVAQDDIPFRVTLAWSDPPGPTISDPYINNLDLAVTVGGETYLGNVFSGDLSVPGGKADVRNNVESVFLPAGVQGSFVITITATNLAGDGVPANDDPTDQDFALVCTNCHSYATFSLGVSPQAQSICAPDIAEYTVGAVTFGGFSEELMLQAAGVPTSAIATFDPNPVLVGEISRLTIDQATPAVAGEYTIRVTAGGAVAEQTTTVGLEVLTAPPGETHLTSPPEDAVDVSLTPTLAWDAVPEADHYVIEVAGDAAFTQPIYSVTTTASEHRLTQALRYSTPYYWRVVPANVCGQGIVAASRRFTTRSFVLYFPMFYLFPEEASYP